MNRTRNHRGGAKTKGDPPSDLYFDMFEPRGVDVNVFRHFLKPLRGVNTMKLMVQDHNRDEKKILLIGEIHGGPKCPGFNEIRIGDALRSATAKDKLDFMIEARDETGGFFNSAEFRKSHSDWDTLNRLRFRINKYLPDYTNPDKARLKTFPNAHVHWLELGMYNIHHRADQFAPWFQDLFDYAASTKEMDRHKLFIKTQGENVMHGYLIQVLFQCTKAPNYKAKLKEFMQYVITPGSAHDKQTYLAKSLQELLPETNPFYTLAYNWIEKLRDVHKYAEPKCESFNLPMFAAVFYESPNGGKNTKTWNATTLGDYVFDFQRFTVDVYAYCRIMRPVTQDGYFKNIVVYAGDYHIDNLAKMIYRSGFGHLKNATKTKKYPLGIPINPLCR